MCKYNKNEIVLGMVTGIEKYGIFVGLDEYYSGLIHISEISNDYVKNIGDYVNVGETIKVKVLEVNEEDYQVKLSIKDVNYRINKQNNSRIREIGTGFEILQNHLEQWIKDGLSS